MLKVRKKCLSCVHLSNPDTEWDALGPERLPVTEYIKVPGIEIAIHTSG